MLTVACREVGQDCDCVVGGETEEELMKNAAEHVLNMLLKIMVTKKKIS
jgi:predicted small metal-binding protein